MKYDFTSIMDRHGHDSIAVDAPSGAGGKAFFGMELPFDPAAREKGIEPIPMWIADMNFPTVPTIPQAIIERAQHPAYGYYLPRQEYFDAIIRWHEQRNGVTGLTREHIGYENGVLGGIVSALKVLCGNGDPVLLHSPTYIGFTHCIEDNGWDIVLSPLKLVDGVWRMDYEDMEKKIVARNIHAAVFCSPHNPTGRVWERWELEKAMEIYKKHDVYVISDEIWSDLLLDGRRHIPLQSVSEDARQRTIAIYAPSKTFNLAGLIGSYRIIYNAYLRDRVARAAASTHYNAMNVLSMYALIGGYSSEGMQWVDELCSVLSDNVRYACDFIDAHFAGVSVVRPQGTYMLFLDCTQWCAEHGKTVADLLAAGYKMGVIWQDGRPFHGANHIRMNLALPRSRVEEAFDRLAKYVF